MNKPGMFRSWPDVVMGIGVVALIGIAFWLAVAEVVK